jgi:hypothetical protein
MLNLPKRLNLKFLNYILSILLTKDKQKQKYLKNERMFNIEFNFNDNDILFNLFNLSI